MTLADKLKAIEVTHITPYCECCNTIDKMRDIAIILAEACESNMSAHKSGCVEYKNCACWWQNASEAITKAQALIGGE